MLLILLAIFSNVDGQSGQILPDEEEMTHKFTQNVSVHEVTYEANGHAEDSANVIHMAASPPQIRVNISKTRIVLPEITSLSQTIIHEIAHGTNVHADAADVAKIAAPFSYQHDILTESTHLSDILDHVATQRQTIDMPVEVNYNHQVSEQPVNVELQARPNIYLVSQPISVNYINSADSEVKLDKENVVGTSVYISRNRKSQSTEKFLHKKTDKRPAQEPVRKKTTRSPAQKPVHRGTVRGPSQKPVRKKTTKRPTQKPVRKKTTRKLLSVSHSTDTWVARPVNFKAKIKNNLKVKIKHAQGHINSRIASSNKSPHKKHAKRTVKKVNKSNSLTLKEKHPLNIRIDEHTRIQLQPKSHLHLVSTNVDNPERPVDVNVNVHISPRNRPHMHPHREPMGSTYSEMRHAAAHRRMHSYRMNKRPFYSRMRHIALHTYTNRRQSTRYTTKRRVTLKPTTRRPTTAGTVKLTYDVWLKFGGCEYMVRKNAKNYDDAEATCRRHGAHLVSIHSEAENNFIHKITSTGSGVKSYEEFVYIGLRMNSRNEWGWIDGSPLNYKKWARYQPDFPEKEKCGQFYQGPARLYDVQDYHWNSLACERPMKYYVCKKCKGSHHHRNKISHHHQKSHRRHCCCSCHSCEDMCKDKCDKSHKREHKPSPAQPFKPPRQIAVFPGQAE